MTKFIAFAADMSGTPEARYDLITDEAEAAAQEARQYLNRHQMIEVWSTDRRRGAGSSGNPTSRTSRPTPGAAAASPVTSRANGYDAAILIDICNAILAAKANGKLSSSRYEKIYIHT